jgi:hypothetical protein
VYYVGKFTGRMDLRGENFPSYSAPSLELGNVSMIASTAFPTTLAHEVFHVLENRRWSKSEWDLNLDPIHFPYFARGIGEYKREDSTNLMVTGKGTVAGEKELNSARLSKAQQDQAYLNTTVLKDHQ